MATLFAAMVTTVGPAPKEPVCQFTAVAPEEVFRTRLFQSTEVTADESAKNLVVAETLPVQSVTAFVGDPSVTDVAISPRLTSADTTLVEVG